ncbi:MAG: MBOAT family protein [Coriobacteriales bacterium]|nr:MBOAT family protein [Coriobacteriales bacterium]
MTLASPAYFAFLGGFLSLLWLVRPLRFKRYLLLAASWLFYGLWDWRLFGFLAAMTVLTFTAAAAMAQRDARARKALVVTAVVLNVGVLACFKYVGFFTDSLSGVLGLVGWRVNAITILAPIGISFLVFQSIAYVVDVYRGDIEPAGFVEVATLVAFFPHILAGPILRPGDFIDQLRDRLSVSREDLDAGIQQFVGGLAMKVLIADRLATFVDPVMNRPELYSTGTLWLATFAYAIHIYADFAGYSHMAIGSARCMGLRLPANFNAPYASFNITEFWRRWHISLSNWLKTYLYIPLGGNRSGKARQALNLTIVMVLAGLWHGAGWNFVIWGALHGAGLVAHKLWTDRFGVKDEARSAISATFAWAVTLLYICLAWIFFRITDVATALSVVRSLFEFGRAGVEWMSTWALLLVPAVLACSVIYARLKPTLQPLRLATFRGAFAATFVLLALALFWPTQSTPFIYLQF